jgi:hypothetical protein
MQSRVLVLPLFIAVVLGNQAWAAQTVDWAQPAVGCIEELAPRMPSEPCPDLSGLKDPLDTIPGTTAAQASSAEVCRGLEIQRRIQNGSLADEGWPKEYSWMVVHSLDDRDTKISEIYDATERYGIPPQILFGALKQESFFSNIGISADGGNYSCGIGQISVHEWCQWANTLDSAAKRSIDWPDTAIPCDIISLPSASTKPFYDIVRRKNSGISEFERRSDLYGGIGFNSVKGELGKIVTEFDIPPTIGPHGELIPAPAPAHSPAPPPTAQDVTTRFQAASSFTRHCTDVSENIRAKAFALHVLYDDKVPAGLKTLDTYAPGESFHRKCMRSGGGSYPLSTAWLTAVAMYNAGPRFIPRVASYYRMTKETFDDGSAWKDFTPKKMIEGLLWGGKYNPASKDLDYFDLDGSPVEASWFKACVVQRHIAHVIEYASIPGHDLVGTAARESCEKRVPGYRQNSPGQIPLPAGNR